MMTTEAGYVEILEIVANGVRVKVTTIKLGVSHSYITTLAVGDTLKFRVDFEVTE